MLVHGNVVCEWEGFRERAERAEEENLCLGSEENADIAWHHNLKDGVLHGAVLEWPQLAENVSVLRLKLQLVGFM